MKPEIATSPEKDFPILAKINATLVEIGSKQQWIKPPEYLPEYENLRGKSIVMVEDTFDVLENVLPELVLATDGHARGIHYKKEDGLGAIELVANIMEKNPDIVLLDYHLSETLKGTEVTKKLKEAGFSGVIVGCSSESQRDKEFLKVGAVGNIDKSSYPLSDAIVKLAALSSGSNS